MAGTSGLSSNANGQAGPILAWLAGGTAPTLTFPLKVVFLSTVRTSNNTASGTAPGDVEWASGGNYVQSGGGTTGGVSGTFFPTTATNNANGATIVSNAAVTRDNAPAQQWAGNRLQDSSATNNKELWYAPLTGGTKTVNAGDTCTIPSGSLTLNLG